MPSVKAILVGQTNAIPRLYRITLPATGWTDDGELHTLELSSLANYLTPNSKIDMQLTSDQMIALMECGVSMIYVTNNNGTAVVNAIGGRPVETVENVQFIIGEVKEVQLA